MPTDEIEPLSAGDLAQLREWVDANHPVGAYTVKRLLVNIADLQHRITEEMRLVAEWADKWERARDEIDQLKADMPDAVREVEDENEEAAPAAVMVWDRRSGPLPTLIGMADGVPIVVERGAFTDVVTGDRTIEMLRVIASDGDRFGVVIVSPALFEQNPLVIRAACEDAFWHLTGGHHADELVVAERVA